MIQDLYQVKARRPFVPGAEIAGVVVAVGPSVCDFVVGDRVMARCGTGGLAEFVAVDASRCTKIPDAMSMEDAAAFQFAYETAYHALKDRAKLRPGEKVLVLGASGGVGIAAIQIAKAMGARVFALVSSPEKLAFVLKNGVDEGAVYDSKALDQDKKSQRRTISRLVGDEGVDVVVDPVGGPLAEAALRSAAEGARYLVLGFTAGIPTMPLNIPLLKSAEIHGVNWRSFSLGSPGASSANRQALLAMYRDRKIAPPITAMFPLSRSAEAIGSFARRTMVGKSVIVI